MKKCESLGWPKVTRDYYRRVFCQNFNIGFASPKTDTCNQCEANDIKLKSLTVGSPEYEVWNKHKQVATVSYELLRNDTSAAHNRPADQHTVVIDLQQALPTPKLSVGPAFYSKKGYDLR